MQITVLSAKVGHLEATVEDQGRRLGDVDSKIDVTRRELGEKLDHISSTVDQKTRMPMLPFVTLLVVAGGFLLTIMTLVNNAQSNRTSGVEQNVKEITALQTDHHDGHPVWVTKLMAEKFSAVLLQLRQVDEVHNKADVEQEEDINQLRITDGHMERRNDTQDARLAILETQMVERTRAFEQMVDLRAADRWTKTQDDDRTRAHDRAHEALGDRLGILERRNGAIQ